MRWKSGAKSGYMPAYKYDPYLYRQHKSKGGTFKNYPDKTFRPLSDHELMGHLTGKQVIGVYPMLTDNTSKFIAADFDKGNWLEEAVLFQNHCAHYDIPSYLERSRSGNGAHVWIFFEKPYSALRSRKLIHRFLVDCGVISSYDKGASFDRLFPNQDYLSGMGLGNLIALPLQGKAMIDGNSCFLDQNQRLLEDQWAFLEAVTQVSATSLGKAYDVHFEVTAHQDMVLPYPLEFQIDLGRSIRLHRSQVTLKLRNFLQEKLNVSNSKFYSRKNSGKQTWGTKRYLKCFEEHGDYLLVPRGFIRNLISFCHSQSIPFKLKDQRELRSTQLFQSSVKLRTYQKPAVEASERKDFGIIVAPPGTGKTIIALEIIRKKCQPALVLVHRQLLLDQWLERIESFFAIPKKKIGIIAKGKVKLGEQITVAMVQTLGKYLEKEPESDLKDQFGTLIVDECHHVPAESFRTVVEKLSPYYQYGLTATPFRKGSDTALIFLYLGNVISTLRTRSGNSSSPPRLFLRKTDLEFPFDSKSDPLSILSKMLIHDSARNRMICQDILAEVNKRSRVVVITERKDHLTVLWQFLKGRCECLTLSGADQTDDRASKMKRLRESSFEVLLTTGQLFGEGTDISALDSLFLVFPFSFKGKLIQYIGRAQRSEQAVRVFDYHDHKIPYLHRMFLKRNRYYRHFARQASLFDDHEQVDSVSVMVISKVEKVKFNELRFCYGRIEFCFSDGRLEEDITMGFEHEYIRPELDVLKPYLSKSLGLRFIEIEIYIEVVGGKLVSQMASCDALSEINQGLIEVCKKSYQYESVVCQESNLRESNRSEVLGLQDVQSRLPEDLKVTTAEQLLEALLMTKQVQHYRNLRYLGSQHCSGLSSIKFSLSPFSFLFVLQGSKQRHIVLETLDTQEATYIWSFTPQTDLTQAYQIVEEALNSINRSGRKAYLKTAPKNFARVKHDYQDERSGFVLWRDQLREVLH